MKDLNEQLANIDRHARMRAESVETAVASLIGNAEVVLQAINDDDAAKAGEHTFNAFSHFAVLLGNVASALNEIAAAQSKLAVSVAMDIDTVAEAMEAENKPFDRTFLGKGPKSA